MAADFYQVIASPLINGSDIFFTPNGNILTVDGVVKTQQRLLRRYFTNPGDYMQHPEYGAGLPQTVGKILTTAEKEYLIATMIAQTLMEASVASSPAPVVKISQPSIYQIDFSVSYTDAPTNTTQVLAFSVTN